ncbi:MAG: 23S rRNA (guanosine(2251)-2'-O)-methyltransferase RlmB, partial [Stellaceae bacterium]
AVHQGLALEVEPLVEPDIEDLLRRAETAAGRNILVALDQVADPHNVGAVLRSAAAFGAGAVLIPAHSAPPVGGALAKSASGALERVPLIRVVNLARALDRLKQGQFWVCGLEETAAQPLSALDLGRRVAIVLGSEGRGMRRLVRERCDYLARLPTLAAQPTLNVSNAVAVALYELVRLAAPG